MVFVCIEGSTFEEKHSAFIEVLIWTLSLSQAASLPQELANSMTCYIVLHFAHTIHHDFPTNMHCFVVMGFDAGYRNKVLQSTISPFCLVLMAANVSVTLSSRTVFRPDFFIVYYQVGQHWWVLLWGCFIHFRLD